MSLQAKYDPREDRMQLTLQPVEGKPQAFWVTRRQWLALLRRLRVAALEMGCELSASEPVQPPRGRPPRNPAADSLEPVLLDGLRLKPEGDGVRLMFVVNEKARGIFLKEPGLRQLMEIVAVQADRAGWDLPAGLQRLQANELAKAAMNRAGRARRSD